MEFNEYTEKFESIIKTQLKRIEAMKNDGDFKDYQALDNMVIGIIEGDGIGPAITKQTYNVLQGLLKDEVEAGKVTFKLIKGCTIENRVAENKAIPEDVLAEIKTCDVLLKGPTTTPRKGDKWPNVESANVAMRKELDLFANVRPVKIPDQDVDWTFFRENTECLYAMGSQGVTIEEDLAMDFRVITTQGTERIARLAFEFARNNGKKKVTIVTKANIVKSTDGKFLDICQKVAKEYPEIEVDDWYIDIMVAKLVDPKRRSQFEVFILPNLYGDIITDEAAELQGGVGTAGSANLGKRQAMFEAVHGSAPRMVEEGREIYANPASVMRAAEMMLNHIGYHDYATKLANILSEAQKEINITGHEDGNTAEDLSNFILERV